MSRPPGSGWLIAAFFLSLLLGGACPGWAEYRSKGKRDPFVPLLTKEGQRLHPPGLDEEEEGVGVAHLVLQGIVFDRNADSYAIINGQVVRAQDDIEGMKILTIEPTAVTVLVEGQRHKLTLHQPEEETQQK